MIDSPRPLIVLSQSSSPKIQTLKYSSIPERALSPFCIKLELAIAIMRNGIHDQTYLSLPGHFNNSQLAQDICGLLNKAL
jgi:hypothetical protein